MVNAVLLRPLPYADAGRLVLVWQDMRNRDVWDFPWPPADFADLREDVKAFEGVAALVTGRQVIAGQGDSREAEQVRTGAATPNLFRLLGTRVALGSTTVRQRTAEIGVRMAFGAQPRQVFHMMVGYGIALTAVGLVIGIAAAFKLCRQKRYR